MLPYVSKRSLNVLCTGVGEATSSVVKSTALQKSQTMSNSDSFQESQESDDVNLIGQQIPCSIT